MWTKSDSPKPKRIKASTVVGLGCLSWVLIAGFSNVLAMVIGLFAVPSIETTSVESEVQQLPPVAISQPELKWSYYKTTEQSGATSYIFSHATMPKFSIAESGTLDVNQINEVLGFLSLPLIDRNVPELESLTGSRYDRGEYLWNDYPLGPMTIRRGLSTYDGISKITISDRSSK
jgi:hypothetical protein